MLKRDREQRPEDFEDELVGASVPEGQKWREEAASRIAVGQIVSWGTAVDTREFGVVVSRNEDGTQDVVFFESGETCTLRAEDRDAGRERYWKVEYGFLRGEEIDALVGVDDEEGDVWTADQVEDVVSYRVFGEE